MTYLATNAIPGEDPIIAGLGRMTRLATLACLALLGTVTCGCRVQQPASFEPDPSMEVSDVPLRIQVVADISDTSMVERQWLADSEQAIEITQVDVPAFLASPDCQCDVLLFPARLLGEAVDRDWLNKLPASVSAPEGDDAWELTNADRAQASYDGDLYGVPLGCAIPVFVASESLAGKLENQRLDWPKVLATVKRGDRATVASTEADLAALVDRYLAIVATVIDRSPTYGLLFELQTMNPRLDEAEFVQAAEILLALAEQPCDGSSSVLLSHDEAWRWAAGESEPCLAIASAAQTSDAARRLTTGAVLDLKSKNVGWNTGGGLLAALADDCRQSSRAAEFLLWLRQSQTRNALASLITGVQGTASVGADSLAWQAQQQVIAAKTSTDLPREPSLPLAEALRGALGEQLLRMLEGTVTPKQGLSEAARRWRELIQTRESELRNDYEKSLGLTL